MQSIPASDNRYGVCSVARDKRQVPLWGSISEEPEPKSRRSSMYCEQDSSSHMHTRTFEKGSCSKKDGLTGATDPSNVHERIYISNDLVEASVAGSIIIVCPFVAELLPISPADSQYMVVKVVD